MSYLLAVQLNSLVRDAKINNTNKFVGLVSIKSIKNDGNSLF